MKLKTLIQNYRSQNTPDLAHRIGNWLLSAGAAGVAMMSAPELLREAGIDFTWPYFVVKALKGLIALGVFGKIFTKLMGEPTK